MKQQIQFIKGKNLGTKSINDLVVTGFFEINKDMYEKIHNYINKVLTMTIEYKGLTQEFRCNINTDTKGYISFADDHGVLRLDITLDNILLTGYILSGDIYLTLE